jgi:hypothetical protein
MRAALHPWPDAAIHGIVAALIGTIFDGGFGPADEARTPPSIGS